MNGALDGPLNALNVSTHRHVRRTPVFIDGVFQSDAFMAMLKKSCIVPFPGGRVIAGNITFDTLIGKAYDIGEDFDLSERKTDEQLQFHPRYLEANVTTSLEMLEVLNVGDDAMYRDVDSKLRNGYNSIGSWLAVSAYLKNSTAGYGKFITGITEAISDGSTNGWDGSTYASYGGITRSSYYGALTSYVNNSLAGAPIEYDDVADAIEEVSWGDGEMEPNIFLTTPKGFTSFKKRYQVQQQLTESTPVIGFKGFSLEGCTVIKSRYCPGQNVATVGKKANRVAVNFLSGTTASLTTYPSVSGETAFLMNLRKPNIHLHVSTAARYQFGWSGWKITARNTKLSGQILWAGQLTVDNPSFFGQIVNFT